ncbi:MAG: isoleucine--tRNA ligase [Candidatus Nanopelagicales bacterium]
MYRAVPPRIDLPAMEREVLRFWNDKDVFHRSLAQTANGPSWVFYEGPPTANGTPGTHHVEARVFKDIFPRFKTMQGFNVPRKAGWDCHGLPVELAVEKELGFGGKGDIEAYGIAEFNKKCRESVVRHVDQFEQLTERMGYWVDTDAAYWTMDTSYIQSVWWSLKRIFDAGLLTEDHRVAPYCPRCGTGLSDHELAQGYEDIVDPSVYVRFPLTGGNVAARYGDVNLLVWTTTPWTLVSNTAVAVRPTAEYLVAALADGEKVVVAAELADALLGEGYEVLERFPGTALERASYSRPFELIDVPNAHFVVLGDYVTTEDGTGLVHLAPAFGADDLAVCRGYGLPVVNPIRPDGTFEESVPLVGGEFFKAADPALVADLEARGLMFARRDYEHAYPHCWRCHTPLLYYAQPSWYIRTTAIKQQLLDANAGTNWYPENIKLGRFGDWLENNVDWALSRNRYWGTPLPIWRCANGHAVCVESLAELGALAGQDLGGFDPHRPFVDDIAIACQDCGLTSYRVPEVIDGWYDSGAMPFAQWGYPHANQDVFDQRYPADFICEAIDQTRGWFYTLMAIGVLTFDESAYKDVLCLGHILDADGRKMSKHLGNVVEPIGLMDRHGADGLRWFMLASGSPWQGRRVGDESITETVRKVLLTFWSTASFQSLYGRIADFDPLATDIPPAQTRCSMDRWAISEANRLVAGVEDALNSYDTQVAGRLISTYIDDLSNWYVRRSRRRFWDGDVAALATLHECLRTVTLLMAPFTPFITERVWDDLFVATESDNPESVHLASWPQGSASLVDDELRDNMALLRRLVELGRAARASSKMKTRQPLSRALVSATGWTQLPDDLVKELTDEINVLGIENLASTNQDLVEVSAKANFRELGKRYGKQTPAIAALIGATDPRGLVDQLEATGAAELGLDGQPITVTAADVVVTQSPRQGWAVATDSGETVALDLMLTDELRSLGLTRDVVREVQEARKNQGFEVTDRISLRWDATDAATARALREHSETIAGEVLATEFIEGSLAEAEATQVADLGLTFSITRI